MDTERTRAMRELVERGHAHRTRDGGKVPSWIHAQSVAEILEHALGATGELANDAALLEDVFLAAQAHDLYEDTDVAPDEVRARFGSRVDQFMRGATNEPAKVAAAPDEVKLIKLADLLDDALSCAYGLHDIGPAWARSSFIPIAEAMRAMLARASFWRFPRTADLLRRQLDFALARLLQNVEKFERTN